MDSFNKEEFERFFDSIVDNKNKISLDGYIKNKENLILNNTSNRNNFPLYNDVVKCEVKKNSNHICSIKEKILIKSHTLK